MLHDAQLHSMAALPSWWPSRAGWTDFLTSPGFAGVMAVVAASIAGFFVSRQVQQARRQHADKQWWESLKWTFDVINGGGAAGAQLGPDVSISLLLALQQEAKGKHGTELQRSTIGALAAVFSTTPEADLVQPSRQETFDGHMAAGGDEPRNGGVSQPPKGDPSDPSRGGNAHGQLPLARVTVSSDASDHLRSLLENAKAASPQASERLLEMAIYDALLVADPTASVLRPSGADLGFDLGVTTPDGLVAIDMKAWRKLPPVEAIRRSLQRLTEVVSAHGLAGGVLVVTTPKEGRDVEGLADVASMVPQNIRILFWRDADATALYEAVRGAARGRDK